MLWILPTVVAFFADIDDDPSQQCGDTVGAEKKSPK